MRALKKKSPLVIMCFSVVMGGCCGNGDIINPASFVDAKVSVDEAIKYGQRHNPVTVTQNSNLVNVEGKYNTAQPIVVKLNYEPKRTPVGRDYMCVKVDAEGVYTNVLLTSVLDRTKWSYNSYRQISNASVTYGVKPSFPFVNFPFAKISMQDIIRAPLITRELKFNLIHQSNGKFLLTDFTVSDMPGFQSTFDIPQNSDIRDMFEFITRISLVGVDPTLLVKVNS